MILSKTTMRVIDLHCQLIELTIWATNIADHCQTFSGVKRLVVPNFD